MLSHYQRIIEEEISSIAYPSGPEALYEPVRYMMALGGKRIRPVLCLLSCEMFGGDIQQALRPAVALEVFHNFTLVHDDIMDNAPLRRGMATVHEKWNMPTAILSGDVMLVLAYDLLNTLDNAIIKQGITLFNETAKRVCEGQQLDMLFERGFKPSIDDYINMIGMKTAALLAGSLKMGALVAGASEQDQELIYTFGYTIGTAFQVQDDLLDSYGNEQFGKTIGGDIAANKKTWLTLKAFELAEGDTAAQLNSLFHQESAVAGDKVQQVLAIYHELNIKTLTEEVRDRYFDEAMACLDKIAVPEEKKNTLRHLATFLINREK